VGTECRQQAFIDAPLEVVWGLASDPDRQTEWWPDTITFECIDGDFEQGCHIRNVQRRPWPMSDLETTLELDRKIPGKELLVRCMDTGTYTRAVLTEGQGGTFVEMEAGNDPTNLNIRLQVAMAGQRLFRRWVEHALEKLKRAAESARAATPRLMGDPGLEPGTSSLSEKRSNRLS
jgi:polyketide cyclase/dehydrase/lipid transport protein